MFLEYYAGSSEGNRESRFIAAFGDYGYSVPMAIVGSGYRFSQGPADYYTVFKSMIEAERARPPRAAIAAWWRKVSPSTLRLYATVRNESDMVLDPAGNEAGVWGLAWEQKATLGVTGMYTRAAVRSPLAAPLPPGAGASLVLDLWINAFVDWNNLYSVVAAELRPGGASGPYDMLQAVRPLPAGLACSPAKVQLAVPQGPGAAELRLTGPHVLAWTATGSAPWLHVSPPAGGMDATVRVEARPELLQPGQQQGIVTIVATSADGMGFTAEVPVTASFDPSWTRSPTLPRRRLARTAPPEASR